MRQTDKKHTGTQTGNNTYQNAKMAKNKIKQIYTFREGLGDGLPIALGYLTVSFGFGIAAVQAGLYPLTALIVSLINETSAGQTAGLTVLAAHAPLVKTLIEMAVTQFVINLRYALMAISLSQRVDGSFTIPARLVLGFSITDEIFAVASTKRERVGTHYFAGLCLLPYTGWAAGTLVGALAGSLLPTAIGQALGIVLYGMFLALILPPARRERGILVAVLVAAGLSCLIRYIPIFSFISSGFSIIISGVCGALVAAWLCPVSVDPEPEEVAA